MGRHAKDPNITTEYLNECFKYDETSGKLIWKERPLHHFRDKDKQIKVNKKYKGKVAGYNNKYKCLYLNKKLFLAHRIIWKMMTGNWPKELIDHIDGNGLNNRWNNLREASHKENMHNTKARKTNGYKGVSKHNGYYIAKIYQNNKNIIIGYYQTELEARQAYYAKAIEVFGDFARVENPEELLPIPNDIFERSNKPQRILKQRETEDDIQTILKKYDANMKYLVNMDNKIWRFQIVRNGKKIISIKKSSLEELIKIKIKYFKENKLL